MVLNYIWVALFVIAFLVALVKLILHFAGHPELGGADIFPALLNVTFEQSKFAIVDFALPLIGTMTLWLGLLKIGERAGAIAWLARLVNPFFSRLFPGIPEGHPAYGNLMMNFSANMLGLDNAATPMGLRAMKDLQELNPEKDKATNAQIMFLVLNTSGLTIIPLNIMMQRKILGAANPSDIFLPLLIATYVATLAGLIYVCIKQKINLFDKVLFGWLACITALIGGVIYYFSTLTQEQIAVHSTVGGSLFIFCVIIAFLVAGFRKKINMFEAFIEGAKSGFETGVMILPYLVAFLVGIGLFRASGALNYIVDGIVYVFHLPEKVANALPTAFMKPLSGGGARTLMIDTMRNFGADSFSGRLSSVFQGATDTTFLILAMYFGSVGVTKTRYAVLGGLIADIAGILAAIAVTYFFFG